jgi:outer membrane protein assembly factor BamA
VAEDGGPGEIHPFMTRRLFYVLLRTRFQLLALLTCALLAVPGRTASAQQTSGRLTRCAQADEVQHVDFVGNPKFPDAEMALLIVNVQPTFLARLLHRAKPICVDTLEVQRDALRLAVLHRLHGWFMATVVPRYDRSKDGLTLKFDVTAGPEARIDSVTLVGLPETEPRRRPFNQPLLSLKGRIFDRVKVQTAVDTAVSRLRDAGYARATQPSAVVVIDTASASDSTPAKVHLSFTFVPGARLRVGEVHVRIQGVGEKPTVDSADVVSLTRLRAGQRFSASNIAGAQRDLYRTDAFRLVLIDTIAPRVGSRDSVIDLQLTVAQARTKNSRVGVGWATQDCGRVQARTQDRAFLAPGRRAELSLRASKIGIGAPLDFAESLCSASIRNDPFSKKLNYYAGTTISNTRFFGLPFAPTGSIYTERRSEPLAYLRETAIGALFELSSTKWRRTVITPGLQYERGRTISDPLISCTRFNLCEATDENAQLFGRGVGVASLSGTHDRTNDATNPTYGTRLRADLRAGITSDSASNPIYFYRGTFEGTGYTPFLGGIIAARIQLARVFAPGAPVVNGSPLIPQQERLFAGGQNSVRGFNQNLLGPLVYAFTSASKIQQDSTNPNQRFLVVKPGSSPDVAVPRGGTELVVSNVEWRRRVSWPTNKLQIALFTDAGTVFESADQQFEWRNVRVTPGFGLRLDTPLGPFRVDLGYNPYEQAAGRALYFTGNSSDQTVAGTIQCVSAGNTNYLSNGSAPPLDLNKCPSNYRPTFHGTLSRFVFHFSLGQAF